MPWTLEYNGVEQSFAQWGFAEESASLQVRNMAMDIFSVTMPQKDVFADPAIPFEGAVIIRRDRVWSGSAWTAGAIEFSGKRLMHTLDGQPSREDMVFQFGGPWYDIDQCAYQQQRKVYSPSTNGLVTEYLSDVVLFQKLADAGGTTKLNTGQQITATLQHVLDQYALQGLAAPFVIGTIGVAVNLVTYQLRDAKCSEVIQYCLRCSPNTAAWFDYTTSPPTINVTQRGDMVPVPLAVADSIQHRSLQLTPRYDLQARSVVLYFKQTNTQNEFVWITNVQQKYPLTGPDGGLRVLVQSIDMTGSYRQDVMASVTALAIANTRAWWSRFVPELQSKRIRNFSIGTMTAIDEETGAAVDLAGYPNIILDGGLAAWMTLTGGASVVSKRVILMADAAYDQYDVDGTGTDPFTATNGRKLEVFPRKPLHARVTVTNAVTGNYSAVSSFVAAEDIPTGMAQSIYNALAQLQFDGTVTFVGQEAMTGITLGNSLNLTGGRTEWATMAALIQEIHKDFGSGTTTITIGPASHLSPGDLTALFLIGRNRRVFYDPSTVATAKASSSSVTLPQSLPKENTQSGVPDTVRHTATYFDGTNNVIARHDAAAGEMFLGKVSAADVPVAGAGSVKLSLAACSGKDISIQEMPICISGVVKHILVLCSAPY